MIADRAAEQALLAAIAFRPAHMEACYGRVTEGWFHSPSDRELWRLFADHWSQGSALDTSSPDTLATWDAWALRDDWAGRDAEVCPRDPAEFGKRWASMLADAPAGVTGILERLEALAYRDRLSRVAAELRAAAEDDTISYDQAAATVDDLTGRLTVTPRDATGVWLDEFIAQPDDHDPWVIPGLLRRSWRAIIVAGEGAGKSTLLRQLAVCAALGIHPFTSRPTDPARVLIVDLENPPSLNRRAYRKLWHELKPSAATSEPVIRYCSRPAGLNVREPRDRAVIEQECRTTRPDLIIAGPLYKMYGRRDRESDEQASMAAQAALDRIRTRWGCGLVMEHHAPHKDNARASREMRPFGSSAWLRWPEFGIGMTEDPDHRGSMLLGRWRGDRTEAAWPDRLDRGQRLPWTGWWAHGMPDDRPSTTATTEDR